MLSSLRLLAVDAAVKRLQAGKLVAFPTETVYGLGADAHNPAALEALYELKGRPKGHPVIVHLADAEQLGDWSNPLPPVALQLAQRFWPGPLTLIVPKAAEVSDRITGGHPGVGLRIPRHPVALQLLQRFGKGIAAPSANRYGQLSPTTARHVADAFAKDALWILDGEPSEVGIESTILDLTQPGRPCILRSGHITPAELADVLGDWPVMGGPTAAPGNVSHHYAPHTPVYLATMADLPELCRVYNRLVVLSVDEVNPHDSVLACLLMPADASAYNQQLYRCLHDADELAAVFIVVIIPAIERLQQDQRWLASLDRLRRASVRMSEHAMYVLENKKILKPVGKLGSVDIQCQTSPKTPGDENHSATYLKNT